MVAETVHKLTFDQVLELAVAKLLEGESFDKAGRWKAKTNITVADGDAEVTSVVITIPN